jgi:hypothetical protein
MYFLFFGRLAISRLIFKENIIRLTLSLDHRHEGEITQDRISEIKETVEADPGSEEAVKISNQKLKRND